MSLGTGIVLFVVGAILAFAVNIQLAWVNLHLVGYILMAAGVIGVIIGIVLLTNRRRTTTTASSTVDPARGQRIDRRTTDSDDPLI